MRDYLDNLRTQYQYTKLLGIDYFVIKFSGLWSMLKTYIKSIFVYLIFFSVVLLVFRLIKFAYSVDSSGFGIRQLNDGEYIPAKTLWDWMDLILVPLALVLIAYFFNRSERRSERELSIEQHREEALRGLLNDISIFTLKATDDPQINKTLQEVLRARILSILPSLDGQRKGVLLQFLHEAGMLSGEIPIIGLHRAEFSYLQLEATALNQANLKGANFDNAKCQRMHFRGCDLSGSSLRNADLRNADFLDARLDYILLDKSNLHFANMDGAHLGKAKIRKANLANSNLRTSFFRDADLSKSSFRKSKLDSADLTGAKLIRAYLKQADLKNAILVEANLSGAKLKGTDLSGANLTNAIVTKKQLSEAKSLEGAILDGIQDRLSPPKMI